MSKFRINDDLLDSPGHTQMKPWHHPLLPLIHCHSDPECTCNLVRNDNVVKINNKCIIYRNIAYQEHYPLG